MLSQRIHRPGDLAAACLLIVVAPLICFRLEAGEPETLHDRIDAAISRSRIGPAARPVTDHEFMRRLYLDLIGRIPSADEARTFLADSDASKRTKLVDDLLARDGANRHLAAVFDIWMMERRPDQHVPADQWRDYLYRSFVGGKPYNQLASEILAAAHHDGELKPAAKFYLDRNVEIHSMTRDVSRVFFGRDIQCAQCHDHPLITDYLQSEYYGLFSFLNRSFLFQDSKDKKKVALAERAEGEATFESVFEPESGQTTAVPGLPDGYLLDDEPQFVPGEGYRVKPAKDVQPLPVFSRRDNLARLATNGQSAMFNRNIANRLWRHMMGRGLVEPPDLQHNDNPAAFPEVLQILAEQFASSGYDVKAFLREIALTKVYQRSIDLPGVHDEPRELLGRLDELKTQLSFQDPVVERAARDLGNSSKQLKQARSELQTVRSELRALLESVGKAEKLRTESAAELAKIDKQNTDMSQLASAVRTAADSAANASMQLKDDAEIAQAAKLFADRRDKIETDLAALQAKLVEVKSTHQEKLAACQDLKQKVGPLEDKRDGLLGTTRLLTGAELALRRHLDSENIRRIDLQQRIAVLEKLQEYDGQRRRQLALDEQIAQITQQQSEMQTQLTQLEGEAVSLGTQGDQARESLAASLKLLAESNQADQANRTLIKNVQTAAEQTGQALQTLADDADLALAHQTLVARTQQLQARASQLAAVVQEHDAQAENVRQRVASVETQIDDCKLRQAELSERVSAVAAQLAAATQQREASEALADEQLRRLNRIWEERFVIATLKPLTPEQMAESLMQSLGLDHRFRREAEAEWDKNHKDKEPREIAAEERAKQIDGLYAKRSKSVIDTCVRLFAATPGSPQDGFHATIDQALFFANDGQVRGWLSPAAGTLSKRLGELSDDRQVAEELYLSVLSRRPSDDESRQVADYLQPREKDRVAAQQELIWSMVTSLEFRFNH